MTEPTVLRHIHTRLSSAARHKTCRNCRRRRGTLLSFYDVDGNPKVFAFCTEDCADEFKTQQAK